MSASENSVIRLMLVGSREAIAGLTATAAATGELSAAQAKQGLVALKASERQFLHNQAIFTMRRYAYAGTLALTALIAETIHWGYTFNQTMASNRAALRPLITDQASLNSELTTLFNFTKHTPFQFKDMTIAFRQMYVAFQPLGVSVEDTNQVLYGLVNALSEAGRTTPGALNRVSVALQHMAYMGHLTGQTVLQLARDGIPIFNVLQKELGLTGDELHNVGQLGIPTATVLKAISDYLNNNPIFSGAAYRQSLTFSGMLTTLKDNISQMMGALTFGSYSRGPSFLANLNKMFDKMGNTIQRNAAAGHGMSITWAQATQIIEKSYPWMTNVFRALNLIWLTFRALWSVLVRQVVPGLRMGLYFLAPLYTLLLLLDHVTLILSNHTSVFSYIVAVLVARWILMRTVAIALIIAKKTMAFWDAILIARTELLTAWQARLTLAEIRNMEATIALTRGQKILFITMGWVNGAFVAARLLAAEMAAAYVLAGGGVTGLAAAFGVLRVAIMTFLASVPIIGWILLAISALIILYFKWKWFHNLVNSTVTWLLNHWRYVVIALGVTVGPLLLIGYAVLQLIRHFKQLVGWAKEAGKWIGNAWHHVPGHGLVSGAAHLIGLASGGHVTRSGAFLVGESGPELVSLPAGASVSPSAAPGSAIRATPSGNIRLPDLYVTIPVKLKDKVLGEAMAKVRLDVEARA